MKNFFTRTNKNGKLRLRIWRIVLSLVLVLIIFKSSTEILSEKKGRDIREESDDAYLQDLKKENNTENKPNVIVILADDLGYGDLSVMGSEMIKTPNIDSLADEGMLLSNYYSPSPVCSPSRAGLLTGRYPERAHVPNVLMNTSSKMNKVVEAIQKLMDNYSYDMDGISEDEILLSDVLSAVDYKTALFGKWHLGIKDGQRPNDNGFDFFYGALYSNDMKPYEIFENEEIVHEAPYDQSNLTKELTNEITSFIEENHEEPFFMLYASPFPHDPAIASDDFDGTSLAGTYGDCVQELDWSVGEIMKSLEENDSLDNTLIIFTSDNGPWFEGDTNGLRSRKGSNYDGGNQVPFIVWMPGTVQSGVQSDALVSGIDVFPTILNLLDLPLPEDRIIDGMNILPLLTGESDVARDELYLQKGKKNVAIVTPDYKYLDKTASDMGYYWMLKKGPFLYDADKDTREAYDVSELYPKVTSALAEKLKEFEEDMTINLRGWLVDEER